MSAAMFTMEEYHDIEEALSSYFGDGSSRKKRQTTSYSTDPPGDVKSSYILITSDGDSETLTPDTQNSVTISMMLDDDARSDTKMYIANKNTGGSFRELDTNVENGMATASTNEGGVFVAASPVITAYITVATVLFVLAVISIAIIAVVIYFRVRREKWHRVKNTFTGCSRSFQRKI